MELRKRIQKQRIQQGLERILPSYARIPLVLLVIINLIVYEGTQFLMLHAKHWDLALPLDACIPFRPAWIVIYILAYLQWVVGYVLIARESRAHCNRVLAGEIIAKFICMLFFIALPTRIERPVVEGSGVFAALTRSGELDLLPWRNRHEARAALVRAGDAGVYAYGVCEHGAGEAARAGGHPCGRAGGRAGTSAVG